MEDTLGTLDPDAFVISQYPPLKLADRCDRCPNSCSQAFVRVVKVIDGREYDLLLCGHHFNEHEPKLIAAAWLVQDERLGINQSPMSGAPESTLTAYED